MVTVNDYAGVNPAWCPGCGDFGILAAVKKALVDLNIEPSRLLMVSGIGQAGKLPQYIRCNMLNGLHGRPMPAAIGAKLTNPELTVIAVSGDGDGYGEGGNHWIHAMRRNHDVTYLVHNNQVYGLTKGQASPTSDQGFITKTTPQGAPIPVYPLALAISAGAGFIARGFAGDINHLAGLIAAGISHRGFALIDILQPCVSFNQKNTYAWYKERVYNVDGTEYNPGDKAAAYEKAQEWGERIPIGIIYKKEAQTFEEQIPALRKGPLVSQEIDPRRVNKLLDEFV